MEQPVVEAAEQDQVVQAGAAAVDPVVDVVGVDIAAVRAHREPAAAIARPERPANRRRNRTRLAADVQHRAAFARRHRHQRPVAADAPERLRGNARAVVKERLAGAVRSQHRLLQMNDDLIDVTAAATSAGPRLLLRRRRQRSLSDRDQPIGPSGRRWLRSPSPRFRGDVARGGCHGAGRGAQLVARLLDRCQHQRRLRRIQRRLDPDQPRLRRPHTDPALAARRIPVALHVRQRPLVHRPPEPPAEPLKLGAGRR